MSQARGGESGEVRGGEKSWYRFNRGYEFYD